MIYPKTWWFEIVQYNENLEATIENLMDKVWIYRYPRSTIIMYNCGNEFLGNAFNF